MPVRPQGAVPLVLAVCLTAACTRTGVESLSPEAEAAGTTVTDTATTDPATTVPATVGATGTSSSTTTTSATTTPTTTSTTSTTTTTLPPRALTLAFSGDTLPHSPLWRQAQRNAAAAGTTGFDFTPMLAGLAPVIEPVDLAVCHLETPIAPIGEELSTAPRYGVPAEIADAIAAAGYDRCSTASNHTLDRGPDGIDRTIEALAAAGLDQSGMARTPDEIAPHVFDVAGVDVAHLSYTFSFNGLVLPEGEEWRSALIDPVRIVADAATARALGAEVVIVSLHWGEETVQQPTEYQREVADQITASGLIDLVVGHHAHVVQPIEQVNGTWVVYGLGNILSNLPTSDFWPAASQDAMVVTVAMSVAADGTATVARPVVYPTWVDKNAGWEVELVLDELARTDLDPFQRERLERSLARTASIVGDFIPTG